MTSNTSKHKDLSLKYKHLEAQDVEAYFAHSLRVFENSQEEGKLPFSPIGEMRINEEKKEKTIISLSKKITAPGWARIWGAWHNKTLLGAIKLDGPPFVSRLHRARLSISIDDANYWGLGIGSQLMETALGWAKKQTTLSWVDLGVFEGNHRAIRLYEKFKFKNFGCIVDDFRLNNISYNNIYMSKRL